MGTGPVGAYKTQTTALLSFAVMVDVVLMVVFLVGVVLMVVFLVGCW